MDSKAPTVINPNWSNRAIIPRIAYRGDAPDNWAGLVAIALGLWAFVPILLVMFI